MFPPVYLPCRCGEPAVSEEGVWRHVEDYTAVVRQYFRVDSLFDHEVEVDVIDVQEPLPAYQGENPWDTYEHNKGDSDKRTRARADVFKHKAAGPPQPMRPPEF